MLCCSCLIWSFNCWTCNLTQKGGSRNDQCFRHLGAKNNSMEIHQALYAKCWREVFLPSNHLKCAKIKPSSFPTHSATSSFNPGFPHLLSHVHLHGLKIVQHLILLLLCSLSTKFGSSNNHGSLYDTNPNNVLPKRNPLNFPVFCIVWSPPTSASHPKLVDTAPPPPLATGHFFCIGLRALNQEEIQFLEICEGIHQLLRLLKLFWND